MWAHQEKMSPGAWAPALGWKDRAWTYCPHSWKTSLSLLYQPPLNTVHHPYRHQTPATPSITPLPTPPSLPHPFHLTQLQPPNQHTHPPTTTQYHPPPHILYQLNITKYYQTPSVGVHCSVPPAHPALNTHPTEEYPPTSHSLRPFYAQHCRTPNSQHPNIPLLNTTEHYTPLNIT